MIHPALEHVVGQMVDRGEADARHVLVADAHEIDVVDRVPAIAVDQIERAAADAFDGRDVELHRPGPPGERLGAELERAAIGGGRIFDPERHGADAGPVGGGKRLGGALRFRVQDEIDVTLAVLGDVLGAVPADQPEA